MSTADTQPTAFTTLLTIYSDAISKARNYKLFARKSDTDDSFDDSASLLTDHILGHILEHRAANLGELAKKVRAISMHDTFADDLHDETTPMGSVYADLCDLLLQPRN